VAQPGGRAERIQIVAVALVAVLLGLGGFTAWYARGHAYLSDDPAACLNCHVMRDMYEAWSHGSHKAVATCNSCHTPHSFVGKWSVKFVNGFNHSVKFTLDNFNDPIRANAMNRRVAQDNCIRCHAGVVSEIHRTASGEIQLCLSCHVRVGHI